eukprot:14545159-Alexandrium_andersonii.AAC.1
MMRQTRSHGNLLRSHSRSLMYSHLRSDSSYHCALQSTITVCSHLASELCWKHSPGFPRLWIARQRRSDGNASGQ